MSTIFEFEILFSIFYGMSIEIRISFELLLKKLIMFVFLIIIGWEKPNLA